MLKGAGSASGLADALAGQETSSQPQGASQQQRDDLWKDVPGFGATANQLRTESVVPGSDSRSEKVIWQPRDPWRDEPVRPAAAVTESAEVREPMTAGDDTLRGFNNDPATAGQVRFVHHRTLRNPC